MVRKLLNFQSVEFPQAKFPIRLPRSVVFQVTKEPEKKTLNLVQLDPFSERKRLLARQSV